MKLHPDMSQRMLAALFGVTPDNARRWLTGEVKPSRHLKMHLRAIQMLTPPELLRLARLGYSVNRWCRSQPTKRKRRKRRAKKVTDASR